MEGPCAIDGIKGDRFGGCPISTILQFVEPVGFEPSVDLPNIECIVDLPTVFEQALRTRNESGKP